MTDDLVKRLRDACRGGDACKCSLNDAADRIEALERKADELQDRLDTANKSRAHVMSLAVKRQARLAKCEARLSKAVEALCEWDDLIKHQYSGSREAMSDMTYAAQHTAALLAEIEKVVDNVNQSE